MHPDSEQDLSPWITILDPCSSQKGYTHGAGAHFKEQGIQYLCVAGSAVQGDRSAPRRSIQRYAHSSYSQVHHQHP